MKVLTMRAKRVLSVYIVVTEINERTQSEEKEGKLNLKREMIEGKTRWGIESKE